MNVCFDYTHPSYKNLLYWSKFSFYACGACLQVVSALAQLGVAPLQTRSCPCPADSIHVATSFGFTLSRRQRKPCSNEMLHLLVDKPAVMCLHALWQISKRSESCPSQVSNRRLGIPVRSLSACGFDINLMPLLCSTVCKQPR